MGSGVGLRQVGYVDCAGGGQVVVQNGIAYVAHMRSPHGTTIVDVRDPKNPKQLATLAMPPGTHSHKVRVHGDMVVVTGVNTAEAADKSFSVKVRFTDVFVRRGATWQAVSAQESSIVGNP